MKFPAALFQRKLNSNKYDYGYVLVIGGSQGMVGAPWLCAGAALKMGAGLVALALPQSVSGKYRQREVMTLPLSDNKGFFTLDSFKGLKDILPKVTVLAIGCGASRDKGTQVFLRKIIQIIDKPMVIDADGLNALVGHEAVLLKRKAQDIVLTPHLGEFARMTGESKESIIKIRKNLVKAYALRYNLTHVLKGDFTLVSNGKMIFENMTGNPGMAKAGTGDVLTGMIAGLMAQGLCGFDAACLGVYLHGLAGDLAVKDKTQICLFASDIIDYLPQAIRMAK